ncbi:hypothetical protein Tco_0424839 [Tanacetum coccineum]
MKIHPDAICPVCRKVCLDSFEEHAVHCKELPGFKYRRDMVRDVLFDICRRAGISAKKEAPVGRKHACVDLTGVSPPVGLSSKGFTAGQAALKAASDKVTKHEKACIENQHEFIPFAFDTFGFLAPKAVELPSRVQRVMHSNVMTPRSTDVVFKRIGFANKKGLVTQLVARLPSTTIFVGRGNEPDPRDVKIASLKQWIQELEFPQLQQDSPIEEAETESNVWDDGSEDVNPFGGGNPGFHDDHYDNPLLTKEIESEPIIWEQFLSVFGHLSSFLEQWIQELEFPQLQQDSLIEEAETESNVWDDGSEDVNPFGGGNPGFHDDHYDNPLLTKETESEPIIWDIGHEEEEYPFVNKYPSFQEEPIVLVEEESCPVYDTNNDEEEWMPVYDTDIEDVIEDEEGFVGKGGIGGEEDNIEDDVVVANDICSSMIQTNLSVDIEEDVNTKSRELMSFGKNIIIKNRGEHLIRRFAGRGNKPDPRDVKIASLKQRIQELEFLQLQQDSRAEEAKTESNVWDDGSEDVNPFGRGNAGFHDDHYDNPLLTKETKSEPIIWDIGHKEEEYPFVNKYPSFQEEPIVLVEEESCHVYDTDNDEEESMPVYDIDIKDVIKEEEGFVRKGGIGGEQDNIEDDVVVANDICSSMIQTTLSVDVEEDGNTKSRELMSFRKNIIIKIQLYVISICAQYEQYKYHFIRDHILKGDIELHFISTQYQLADIFTKPLDEATIKRLIVELGMLNIDSKHEASALTEENLSFSAFFQN